MRVRDFSNLLLRTWLPDHNAAFLEFLFVIGAIEAGRNSVPGKGDGYHIIILGTQFFPDIGGLPQEVFFHLIIGPDLPLLPLLFLIRGTKGGKNLLLGQIRRNQTDIRRKMAHRITVKTTCYDKSQQAQADNKT